MSEFVNYHKRGIELPPGCKDLIDVLPTSRRQRKTYIASGFRPAKMREERFPTAGLAQIGRYVSMLLQWQGELFTLSLTAQDFEFPVTLYRSRSEGTAAVVLVTKQAQREQAIRAFFEQQGIAAWDLGAADGSRGLAYPLPSDEARAVSLITEMLRSVYGLSDEAGIDFRYYEKR